MIEAPDIAVSNACHAYVSASGGKKDLCIWTVRISGNLCVAVSGSAICSFQPIGRKRYQRVVCIYVSSIVNLVRTNKGI